MRVQGLTMFASNEPRDVDRPPSPNGNTPAATSRSGLLDLLRSLSQTRGGAIGHAGILLLDVGSPQRGTNLSDSCQS